MFSAWREASSSVVVAADAVRTCLSRWVERYLGRYRGVLPKTAITDLLSSQELHVLFISTIARSAPLMTIPSAQSPCQLLYQHKYQRKIFLKIKGEKKGKKKKKKTHVP